MEEELSFAPSLGVDTSARTGAIASEQSNEFGYPPSSAADYSTTNIQVVNVDEPDYVKNDGEHIFIANDHTITIIDATPPKDASISDQFSLIWNSNNKQFIEDDIHDIFLNNDKLIIFLKDRNTVETRIMIMDVTSRDLAEIENYFTVTGDYQSARMIGEFIYLITSHPTKLSPNVTIPNITSDGIISEEPHIERNKNPKIFAFSSNILEEYAYKTITSFDISGNNVNSESYLMGEGNTIYVSPKSIYITYQDTTHQTIDYLDWEFVDTVFPYLKVSDQLKIRELLLENPQTTSQKQEKWSQILEELSDSLRELDKTQLAKIREDLKIEPTNNILQTVIQKIDINDGQFEYVDTAKIKGTILNQFSMDEYDNQFRIATTSSDNRVGKSNNVLVFDIKNSELNQVGFLDKIAINEDIYSARFVGDTLYLVTFRQVDPFFVIDLSNDQPKILGELKIPGFSNYLHPFGDDHVIGIGRDGGVKIALFDVSDFNNPKQAAQVFIGDRRTSSEATDNHKSILIDYEKQLLAIPITDNNNKSKFEPNQPWYGFYVYKATELGFTPKGTVEVKNEENYNGRTLYIGDTLYSISPEMVSINELTSLKEIKIIDLD